MNFKEEAAYWTQRYHENRTGWNIGYPSTPIKTYIDQLKNKKLKILIPGAGNAYEAEYLHQQGFSNVFIMDISEVPLFEFQKRNPNFPKENILCEDFFKHKERYDLILEQTFFCSFVPSDKNRNLYFKQMANLLNIEWKLVGLWFDIPLTGDLEKRPFGGDKNLYLSYLKPHFKVKIFDMSYNSIKERSGNELFGIFTKNNLD